MATLAVQLHYRSVVVVHAKARSQQIRLCMLPSVLGVTIDHLGMYMLAWPISHHMPLLPHLFHSRSQPQ
jgi:hypothetical protein